MSKSTLPIAAAVFVSAGASVWLACGSSTFSGADAGTQNVPTDCNANADPKDSPACVDNSIGIFVSASGDDTHAGTKESPLRTIAAALTKADLQHNRIYLCTGTYAESVRLTGPVSIYGGFSCADWSYAGTAGGIAPKIAPTTPGYALDVDGVGTAMTIEDVELDAQSGQNPGDSSIAVSVASSPGPITFRRVAVSAGDGQPGVAASTTSNYSNSIAPSGTQADHDNGALEKVCAACGDGTVSTGGAGGGKDQNGADGGPPMPENPLSHNGNGGIAPADTGCTAPPHQGADAVDGIGGAAGAPTPGTLAATGWKASSGSYGANGAVGQGGGGGQGLNGGSFNGGGSGGCGGCGGAGGAGGGSGGSAFAILVFQSTVVADSCTLAVGHGGDGQPGGLAQLGQTGGFGGAPAGGAGIGCSGATGGKGGAGAGGGGGAGGNAIAIAYVGPQPSLIGGTQTEGHAGAPGNGGKGAATNDGAIGAPGTKSDIAELQ